MLECLRNLDMPRRHQVEELNCPTCFGISSLVNLKTPAHQPTPFFNRLTCLVSAWAKVVMGRSHIQPIRRATSMSARGVRTLIQLFLSLDIGITPTPNPQALNLQHNPHPITFARNAQSRLSSKFLQKTPPPLPPALHKTTTSPFIKFTSPTAP